MNWILIKNWEIDWPGQYPSSLNNRKEHRGWFRTVIELFGLKLNINMSIMRVGSDAEQWRMRCRRWLRCMQNKSFCDGALPTSFILPPTHSTPATGFVLKADLSYSVFCGFVEGGSLFGGCDADIQHSVCYRSVLGSVITVPVALVTYNHVTLESFSVPYKWTWMHAMRPKHTHLCWQRCLEMSNHLATDCLGLSGR